ncbi:unnamed protein product [Brachionus calyciflorus]|uniref:Uncharacterized protein n=1 Tax=Brachionus calyciflorus TaxID=104777 RepID=A0A813N1L7_9BILA|nr:unnamed protein product [Brachionus calyciflorus]
MIDSPGVLKDKNSLAQKATLNTLSSSKIKSHTSHLISHQNVNNNTPNRRLQANKVESSTKKKPLNQLSKLANASSSNQGTPPTSRIQLPSSLKTSSTSKSGFGINPICNGNDYTEVMLKKSQFGYTGPGYIVEFDCDPKQLRGLRVEKGLWKVSTRQSKNTDAILGIAMCYVRIDEPEKATPLKQLTNYDFSYKPQNDMTCSIRKNLMSNFSSDDMNLESKKAKKCLRWADNLEIIQERQGLTPDRNLIDTSDEPKNDSIVNSFSPQPKRKLRKSLSMSDINHLAASIDSYDNCSDSSNPDVKIEIETNKENLNLTYDKDLKKNSPIQVSKVIHYVVHVSPNKIANSSFLETQNNFLQPYSNFPLISPVKNSLNSTQTLSVNDQVQLPTIIEPQDPKINEELDWDKKLNSFYEEFCKNFTDESCESQSGTVLNSSFLKFINDQNRLNILLSFDKLEQKIRECKMEIFRATYNNTNQNN